MDKTETKRSKPKIEWTEVNFYNGVFNLDEHEETEEEIKDAMEWYTASQNEKLKKG